MAGATAGRRTARPATTTPVEANGAGATRTTTPPATTSPTTTRAPGLRTATGRRTTRGRANAARAVLAAAGLAMVGSAAAPAVTDAAALAGQEAQPRTEPGRPLGPPDAPGGGPLPVGLGFYLIQVRNLDQILQTFEIEGYLKLDWTDPRLAFDPRAFGAASKVDYNDRALEKLGTEVWWPSVEFVTATEGGSLSRHWLEVDSAGRVEYLTRFNAVVTSSMDLRRFPFDEQHLLIPIESYFHGVDQVEFVVDPAFTGRDTARALPEWSIRGHASQVAPNDYGQTDQSLGEYSRFTFTVEIERQWGFYLYKIFLPLLLIVASSWTVFWIRDLGTNVGITFTIMLTVVAFNLAIADTLPKVPYLTFMDAVMVSSYVSVFLALLLVMIVYHFQQTEQEAVERRINRVARWAFPSGLLTAVLLLVVIFLV